MSNEIIMVDRHDGHGPMPTYAHSWNVFRGQDQEGKWHWYRVDEHDPRGRFQLTRAGGGVDPNYSNIEDYPLAEALNEKTRAAVEEENSRFFRNSWFDGRAPWLRGDKA